MILETRKIRLVMQLRRAGIGDTRVLSAIEKIPRESFLPENFRDKAYDDQALPIGHGQTISQPQVVAIMTQALNCDSRTKVLEVGTGSGYQAAVLSRLCRRVYTIERHRDLLKLAESRFHALRLHNITSKCGDGWKGWSEAGALYPDHGDRGAARRAGEPGGPTGSRRPADHTGRRQQQQSGVAADRPRRGGPAERRADLRRALRAPGAWRPQGRARRARSAPCSGSKLVRKRRQAIALGVLAGLLISLAACGNRHQAYNPGYANPAGQPPPAPLRKPAAPEGFLAGPVQEEGFATPGLVQRASIQSQPLQPSIAATPAVARSPATLPPSGRHRVAAGETLYSIARRYSLPLRALIDANRLSPPYHLRSGQTLLIPQPRLHRVAAGETLYSIAARYQVQTSELVRLNRMTAPYPVIAGQQLILPARQGASPAVLQTAAVRTPSPTPSPVPAKKPALATAPPAKAGAQSSAPKTAAPKTAAPAQKPAKAQTAAVPRQAVPTPPPRSEAKFLWPLEGKLIARFGPREGGQHNDGINILAPRGAPVRAAENGVVAYVGEDLDGFGRLVLLKHADGWVSAYAHNSSTLVQRGQKVRRGQTIARVGTTGNVARPQLHFELRQGTRAVDPLKLLGRSSV